MASEMPSPTMGRMIIAAMTMVMMVVVDIVCYPCVCVCVCVCVCDRWEGGRFPPPRLTDYSQPHREQSAALTVAYRLRSYLNAGTRQTLDWSSHCTSTSPCSAMN